MSLFALSMIALALMTPAMAQMEGASMVSAATIPVEQSNEDMVAALMDIDETSTAASIIKTVRLDSIMTPGEKYTWFVASDHAMEALRPDVRNKMMEKIKNPEAATILVKGHLVSGMVTPEEMTDGMKLTMMNGNTMTIRVIEGRMMVDNASISKAVMTNNGIIYVMDRIPSSLRGTWEQMGISPMSSMPTDR